MTFKTLQTRLTIVCSRNLESLPSTYAQCTEQARVELVNISGSHGVSGVFPAEPGLAWGEPKQHSERLLNRLAAGLWNSFSLGCSHVWKRSHRGRDPPVVLSLCSPLFLSRVQAVSSVRFIYLPPPCWENPPGFLGSRRREGSGGLKLCLHAELYCSVGNVFTGPLPEGHSGTDVSGGGS